MSIPHAGQTSCPACAGPREPEPASRGAGSAAQLLSVPSLAPAPLPLPSLGASRGATLAAVRPLRPRTARDARGSGLGAAAAAAGRPVPGHRGALPGGPQDQAAGPADRAAALPGARGSQQAWLLRQWKALPYKPAMGTHLPRQCLGVYLLRREPRL